MIPLLAVGRTKEKGCKELTKIRYSVNSDNNDVRFGFRRIYLFSHLPGSWQTESNLWGLAAQLSLLWVPLSSLPLASYLPYNLVLGQTQAHLGKDAMAGGLKQSHLGLIQAHMLVSAEY